MSKKNTQSPSSPSLSWGDGYILSCDARNQLVGKFITLIEVMGLTEKQEESIKCLTRQAVDEVLSWGIYITPERHTSLRELYFEKRAEADRNGTPVGAI